MTDRREGQPRAVLTDKRTDGWPGGPGPLLLATDSSYLERPAVRGGALPSEPLWGCRVGSVSGRLPSFQARILEPLTSLPWGHTHKGAQWPEQPGRTASRDPSWAGWVQPPTHRVAAPLGTGRPPPLPRAAESRELRARAQGPPAKMRIQGVLWLSRLSQRQFPVGCPRPPAPPPQDSAHLAVMNGSRPGFRGPGERRWCYGESRQRL